jgi:hypothetical protein
MDKLIAETLADPCWFPFRFDSEKDEFLFVRVPREVQESVTFLADLRPAAGEWRTIHRSAVDQARIGEAPLHFILHSGLGGSTLLARALAQAGVVTTLKEPPILTDIVRFGLSASVEQTATLMELVARLLARPFEAGEAVVVKMSSVGNGLVVPMAATRAASRILCLHAPLDAMLSSLARRGLEGRLGGRRLFIGLRNSRFAELGFSGNQLFEQSDLQLAALAWVATQRLIRDCANRYGPERVRSITSEQLVTTPQESLAAIAAHFNLKLDLGRAITSGIFDRHAKTGEPFDAAARERAIADGLSTHGDEIRPIVGWASMVAQANGIPCDLPYPLLSPAL